MVCTFCAQITQVDTFNIRELHLITYAATTADGFATQEIVLIKLQAARPKSAFEFAKDLIK